MPELASPPSSSATVVLPSELSDRLDGVVDGSAIVAWSEFDLDAERRFARQFVALTESELLILLPHGVERIDLSRLKEAGIDESIGSDRMVLEIEGDLPRLLRYTRRCRRDMTRLNRMLSRRINRDPKQDEALPWLETAERRAVQQQVCPKCGSVIPEYAEGSCPRCLQKKQILLRLIGVAKPYRARTYGALAAMVVGSLANAAVPLLQQKLVDKGIGVSNQSGGGGPVGGTWQTLVFWGAMMLITLIVVELLGAVRLRLLTGVGTNVARDLRHQVYAHLNALSLRFFVKRRTGSLITRVTNDTDRLWDFIVFGTVDSMNHAITIAALMGVLLYMNWQLMLIAIIPLPIVVTISVVRSRKMNMLHSRLWTYWARMGAVVGDSIPGVRVVKAFANEDREVARFDRRSNEYTEKEQEVNRVWTQLQPIVSSVMRLGSLFVWVAGGYMVIRAGNVEPWSIGTLGAFGAALWQFYGPIMALANSGRMVSRAATSAQRVFEVLDTPPEIYDRSDAVVKTDWQPRVEFKNVSFSYEGAQPALRDVSLLVEPGTMIGLCGHSGAGKSTFVNLLCRFYDVTDGQILIDGVDIRQYDLKWLRRQIGIVLQEPYLFHGTIAENIRYGQPDATPQQVIAAARAANAHDFIVGLPDGYDTIVGERGQSLSGGERQRISIARAILHDPRILILDEATSSVDTRTERMIQQALDRLVEGRTTFAIAHRLSTLQSADQLIVLEKGRIVEQGTHEALLARPDGEYAKLHKMQAELNSVVALR
jgi:ATP-binding cassette, subfamily B, bacterial